MEAKVIKCKFAFIQIACYLDDRTELVEVSSRMNANENSLKIGSECSFNLHIVNVHPGGYFHIRRWGGGGGLDLTSSLEAKFTK